MADLVVSVSETPVCLSAWCALPFLQLRTDAQAPGLLTIPDYLPVIRTVARYSVRPLETMTPGLFTVPVMRISLSELAGTVDKNMCHLAQAFLLDKQLPAMEWIAAIDPPELEHGTQLVAVHTLDGIPDEVCQWLTDCVADGWEPIICRSPNEYEAFVDRCLRAERVITVAGDVNYFRACAGRHTYTLVPLPTPVHVITTPYDRFVLCEPTQTGVQAALQEMQSWPKRYW